MGFSMREQGQKPMERILDFLRNIVKHIFRPETSRLSRGLGAAWLAGLYLLGAAVWGFFLNWGRIGFDLHDWTQEGPRYAFIRQALLEGRLPLHIGSSLASTDRFLAIPDTVISPQVLLLKFVEPGMFVLLNTLILFTFGFLGLMLIRRKFSWSPLTFTVVYILFILNGHPMAHVAVGHSMWIAYFLLPYFVYLVFELIEGNTSWIWVTQTAFLQLILYLQGGFHFVTWSMMFLIILGITNLRFFLPALKALIFSMLLSMFRILPAALQFGDEPRRFISGYFSVSDLVQAFVALRAPEQALSGMYSAFGWWEADIYTGLLGFVFLIFFGVYLTWRDHETKARPYRSLMPAILVMAILSLGKVFQPVTLLPLPLMAAERVSSRFMVIPFVILLVVAGTSMERYVRLMQWNLGKQLAALLGVGVIAHDLLQHARLWRVSNMSQLFDVTPVDIRAEVLLRNDPSYIAALLGGLGVGVLTLIFLGIMIRRERAQ
jgi:hypothetical protein